MVSGTSANGSAFLTPFAFITFDDLSDFYFEFDIAADFATEPQEIRRTVLAALVFAALVPVCVIAR